jgi:hypothetical protein
MFAELQEIAKIQYFADANKLWQKLFHKTYN